MGPGEQEVELDQFLHAVRELQKTYGVKLYVFDASALIQHSKSPALPLDCKSVAEFRRYSKSASQFLGLAFARSIEDPKEAISQDLDNGTIEARSLLSEQWIAANLPSKQIHSIKQLASDVFENPQIAEEWLLEPNLATDNLPPINLLGTEEGYARVQTLLQRIEFGVLT